MQRDNFATLGALALEPIFNVSVWRRRRRRPEDRDHDAARPDAADPAAVIARLL